MQYQLLAELMRSQRRNSGVGDHSAGRSGTPRGITAEANPLPKNDFAISRHPRERRLDNSNRSWHVRTFFVA